MVNCPRSPGVDVDLLAEMMTAPKRSACRLKLTPFSVTASGWTARKLKRSAFWPITQHCFQISVAASALSPITSFLAIAFKKHPSAIATPISCLDLDSFPAFLFFLGEGSFMTSTVWKPLGQFLLNLDLSDSL